MTEKNKETMKSIIVVFSAIIGLYLIITGTSNIALSIKLYISDYSGLKNFIFDLYPSTIINNFDYLLYDFLDVAFHLLRLFLGVFCTLPARKPQKWKNMFIVGFISSIYAIFYNVYLLHISGQVMLNALAYFLPCALALLGMYGGFLWREHTL